MNLLLTIFGKCLEPGYVFTEEDYDKLCKLIGKETIIQIKTKTGINGV